MSYKKYLRKIVFWGHLQPEKANDYQKSIRTIEWDAYESYISPNSKFLDVGCGSGFILSKVTSVKNCNAFGIDPMPNTAGVKEQDDSWNITKGIAENIPYKNKYFDLVYSSHVLEHVENIEQSLTEFKRVLKDDGTAIIIVPTSTMAWINLFSSYLFTSHIRLFRFLSRPITKSKRTKFIHVFAPYSHGKENKTVFYDISQYKVNKWENIIQNHFKIQNKLYPLLYPYPDYIQLFKARKSKKYSSSVVFICKK